MQDKNRRLQQICITAKKTNSRLKERLKEVSQKETLSQSSLRTLKGRTKVKMMKADLATSNAKENVAVCKSHRVASARIRNWR